jgi:conjugal transfer pilus assembly protein TraE
MQTDDTSLKFRLENICRQRNFFAGCLGLSLLSSVLIGAKITSMSERVVLVPGITREMYVEDSLVSSSYLEETSLLFISALLDLTPTTIDAKKDMILKHVSQRSPASLKSLQTYFAESVGHIKKLQVSTFFAPKKIHVDSKKLEVIADGSLTSIFGKKGFEEKDVRFKLEFDYVGGRLLLKEFIELKPKLIPLKDEKNNAK